MKVKITEGTIVKNSWCVNFIDTKGNIVKSTTYNNILEFLKSKEKYSRTTKVAVQLRCVFEKDF